MRKNELIFTKEAQAKVLLNIAESYGKYTNDEFDLWGDLETGKVLYSENKDEYSEYNSQPEKYQYLTDIFDYIENVYYVADAGIEGMIENNFLQDITVEV